MKSFSCCGWQLKSAHETVKLLKPYSPPEPVAPPAPVRRGRGAKKAEKAAVVPGGAAPVKGKRGRKPVQAQQQLLETRKKVQWTSKEIQLHSLRKAA